MKSKIYCCKVFKDMRKKYKKKKQKNKPILNKLIKKWIIKGNLILGIKQIIKNNKKQKI